MTSLGCLGRKTTTQTNKDKAHYLKLRWSLCSWSIPNDLVGKLYISQCTTKPTVKPVRPAKTQISLYIHPVRVRALVYPCLAALMAQSDALLTGDQVLLICRFCSVMAHIFFLKNPELPIFVGKYLTYTVQDGIAVVKLDQKDAKVCEAYLQVNIWTDKPKLMMWSVQLAEWLAFPT